MKITVKLFGPHKEKLKKDSIFLSLSDNSNIFDLILNLNQFEPGFKENIKSYAIAVNLIYQDKDFKLHDGDEVAIIPPVSGG
mgnify:FL=1